MKPSLLIIDDDEDIRVQMKWALGGDYEIFTAEDRPGALTAFQGHQPSVVLLDLGLPPHPGSPDEGLAALGELLGREPLTKVIVITGQSEKENAVRAIGMGAYDLLCKPVAMDELKAILRRAFYVALREREYRESQQSFAAQSFEGMIGTSPQIQLVFEAIRKVATSEAPVLIQGESGTGKEVAARAIHRVSRRKDGPFVAINCGAIPGTLIESELFGHEKGSFTGAHVQRVGRIETAQGGALLLDEIGELPLALQVKLLRFLQEQTIERVGGRKEIRVDARVIAATNVDLKKAVEEGKFREDLYYRAAVVTIRIPPLRERPGDSRLLVQSLLANLLKSPSGKTHESLSFSPEALRAIDRYHWPGNVRELENRVRRAFIMAEGRQITAEDLELSTTGEKLASSNTLKQAREAVEREMLEQALRKNHRNISAAAADLGVSRPTFYELMDKLGIKRD
jgi:two-component system NtrC family response regulator